MRQVSIGPPLRIGALAGGIVLLANMAVSFAIDSNALARWLLVPAVALGAAALALAIGSPPPPALSPTAPADKPRGRRRSTSVVTASVACIVILGGGGLVLGGAARYAMAWVTGNES